MDLDHDLEVAFFRSVGHWLYARSEELELRLMVCVVGQMDADAECWRILREQRGRWDKDGVSGGGGGSVTGTPSPNSPVDTTTHPALRSG